MSNSRRIRLGTTKGGFISVTSEVSFTSAAEEWNKGKDLSPPKPLSSTELRDVLPFQERNSIISTTNINTIKTTATTSPKRKMTKNTLLKKDRSPPFHSFLLLIRLLCYILRLTCISYYYVLHFSSRRRLRVRCQISSVRISEFICIIVSSLSLLFPTPVTTIITSNVILPMDVTGTETLMSLDGVVGKRVELPCGITPRTREDTVYMVLWFRGEESIPIYSLDVRGKPFSGAKHWSAEIPFGKRAHFRTVSEPARLVIDDVVISDQGMYRCRVDFRNSPSRETRLNLTITVPPEEPLIFESTGLSLRGEVGPYREGSTLELTCIVRGGVPSPLVYWYLNEELLDSSYHIENEREVINHISVPNIQRNHHRAQLLCRASNTLLIPPVSKTVIIELNLRPLSVSILHRHSQLSTDTHYEITCETWGSYPQPLITWWLDSRELRGAKMEDARASNMSISRLTLVPNASIDGQRLTCRSENPLLPGSAMEDSWVLKIVYAPVLSLRMGSSLNPNDIKEGDDVYFECLIKANPPVRKLSWFHNGELLHHNLTAGVILSNQSLVLQRVSRPSGGNYTCKSTNQEGTGESNRVPLEIMYAPTCQIGLSVTEETVVTPIIIAASRSENVNISCEMDALPSNLKFHWTHANTVGESSEILLESYSSSGSRSLLQYHVKSEENFGTLLCWASNSIGSSERPCVYQLVPADVPQPVENCSISNRTSTSAEIICEGGFDGGLPQVFILEAYQSAPSGRRGLQFNISSLTPAFTLSGLDADGMFHFRIYAVNRKGRSGPTIMDGIALHYPAMQSAKAQEFRKTTIAIIAGAVSAVVVTFISLIAFVVHRKMHPIGRMTEGDKSYRRGSRCSSTQDELYHNNSKKLSDALMETQFTPTVDYEEDGDPDLIPSKNVKMCPGGGIAGGRVYSRVSNGEINQQYGTSCTTMTPRSTMSMEKFPLRSLEPNASFIGEPMAMSNYATLRGTKLNGNGLSLKKRETQQMVDIGSFGTLHGKPSSMVVSIDSRLIGQQLASNQLPESCV